MDSLSKQFPEFNSISKGHEVYFSTVMTGPNSYDLLITCEFSQEERQKSKMEDEDNFDDLDDDVDFVHISST